MHDKLVREAWLGKAAVVLNRELLIPSKIGTPEKLHISVGFPAGGRRGKGAHRIGECWQPAASADKHTEIFIHPEVDNPSEVLAILLHELLHASGIWDHGKGFKDAATKVGLTGKMTATVAGETLTGRLKDMLRDLPPYPHAALNMSEGKTTAPKKQSARMIKCECGHCGYSVRTTRKWLDIGNPVCPCGEELQAEGQEADEE